MEKQLHPSREVEIHRHGNEAERMLNGSYFRCSGKIFSLVEIESRPAARAQNTEYRSTGQAYLLETIYLLHDISFPQLSQTCEMTVQNATIPARTPYDDASAKAVRETQRANLAITTCPGTPPAP